MPGDVQFTLGEMSGKLDTLIRRFDDVKQDVEVKHAGHEVRIRALEQWKWLVMGAAAAAGGSVGLIAQKLLGVTHG
jgi:hypothetical protein